MSECEVPNWNLRHQRQEQVEVEGNRSSHWHTQQPNSLFPMPNYEVAELTWENGQLAMHRLGELVPIAQTKRSWAQDGDTLESIIHQGTHNKQNLNFVEFNEYPMIDSVASSGGKWTEDMSENRMGLRSKKKCSRAESGPCQRQYSNTVQEEGAGTGAGASASASATVFRDTDTTLMTWTSLESLPSFKTKTTEEDSACRGRLENQDEEPETKGETGRSLSTRRSRAATVHNQSERRRRDRINQKMRALQKLVPNSSKTDKASMLDEVIEYLKQLQAQVQVMNIRNMNMNMNMPQMMMPIGMQQQLQMSLLARMGMGMGLGMGMGMFDMNTIARTASQPVSPLLNPTSVAAAATPTFVPPPFVVPPMMATHSTSPMTSNLTSNDPRCAFLAQQQSMNMDLYNKMAAIYQQQVNQTAQATSISSQANQVELV